jgi:tripartite-type tricarboxylate transporter receptor subunit TctC
MASLPGWMRMLALGLGAGLSLFGSLGAGLGAGLGLTLGLPGAAQAQAPEYPSRSIRLVVNFPAGGPADIFGRAIAARLGPALGQQVVVDNRGGAGGVIGTDAVAKAAPDGYTLLHASSDFVINTLMHRNLPYDIYRDFAPVTIVAHGVGYLMLVHPGVVAQNVKEFVALAKKPDSRLSFGSGGIGNNLHLAGELFNMRAGTRLVHVPYKGGAPAVNALIAGEIQSLFVPPTPTVLQQLKTGRLRALAFTGTRRWALLPEVPTMVEGGVTDFVYTGAWHGWLAPAKTPKEIIARLQAETQKAMQEARVREPLIAAGYEPAGSSSADFVRIIKSDAQKTAELMRVAGIKQE